MSEAVLYFGETGLAVFPFENTWGYRRICCKGRHYPTSKSLVPFTKISPWTLVHDKTRDNFITFLMSHHETQLVPGMTETNKSQQFFLPPILIYLSSVIHEVDMQVTVFIAVYVGLRYQTSCKKPEWPFLIEILCDSNHTGYCLYTCYYCLHNLKNDIASLISCVPAWKYFIKRLCDIRDASEHFAHPAYMALLC